MPQRTPVLYQAGASPRGRAFAARHAECVFVAGNSPAQLAPMVADLRARAAAQGRDPRDLQIFALITLVPGRTMAEAEAKQDIEASIMAKSNEQPDYLYKWMERRIMHTRSAAIIKREKRRGNLDSETAMQVRAAINPMTAKRLAVAALTPEQQADRRRAQQAEYKRTRRSKGRA
jgi:alkanesulfonate monooxygenase SsuD/methylene tetrahydromethanopterin reductase-like flavin-dependent oxidoreductase (luciferase family)